MKLPNGAQAIIDPRKITDYCLDPNHDEGKHKAILFRELLGMTAADAEVLIEAVKAAAIENEASMGRRDKYGQRYIVEFDLAGKRGTARVRTAWIIRSTETVPRLVTCYIL